MANHTDSEKNKQFYKVNWDYVFYFEVHGDVFFKFKSKTHIPLVDYFLQILFLQTENKPNRFLKRETTSGALNIRPTFTKYWN